jgi:hypothetical protein
MNQYFPHVKGVVEFSKSCNYKATKNRFPLWL